MTEEQWRLRLGMYKSGMIAFDDIYGVIQREIYKANGAINVVEKLSKMGPSWNLFGLVDEAKQTLKEYHEIN